MKNMTKQFYNHIKILFRKKYRHDRHRYARHLNIERQLISDALKN